MARYDSKADFKVHEMKSMGKSRDAEAMELLKRISHQVQPIMRRREWRVPLLSEFFPANANLLGLNIGGGGGRTREIKVRLRPARNPDSFLPYESVLGTMLHELVHNVRGPHDGAFYKLLDELSAECEELMARGVGGTGVGFDGPSCGRLGSHAFIPLHNPATGRLRDCALQAAEERAKRQRIMSTGPRRLGGGGGGGPANNRYLTPAEAAAAAAERRCRDNRWCPCERLAGAVSREVAAQAEAARQRGGAATAAAGTEAGEAPAGRDPSGTGRPGSAARTAPPAGPSASHLGAAAAAAGQHQPLHPQTVAEVEADLIRRIEEGVIDLTLDSDPDSDPEPQLVSGSESKAAGSAAPVIPQRRRGLQGTGDGWRPGGPCPGSGTPASTAAAAAGTLSGAAAGAAAGPSGATGGGAVGSGGAAAAGDAAGFVATRPPSPAPPEHERLRSNDGGVAAVREGAPKPLLGGRVGGVQTGQTGVPGWGSFRAEGDSPRPAGPLGGSGVHGPNAAKRAASSSSMKPGQQQQQPRPVGVPFLSSTSSAAGPLPPASLRPPLEVLQPRNPVAAAAAAAALARLQSQPQSQPAAPQGHRRRRRQEAQPLPLPQQRQQQGPQHSQQGSKSAQAVLVALPGPAAEEQGSQRQQALPPPPPSQRQQAAQRLGQRGAGREGERAGVAAGSGVGSASGAAWSGAGVNGGRDSDVIDLTEE